MGWHFGYNCKYYLPTINKCRKLIDLYRMRKDLIEQKWISTKDMLIYLNLPDDELIKQIATGEMKVKAQTSGNLKFAVSGAWQYDLCPLIDTGGQCMYYESHSGENISCLMELDIEKHEHPNIKKVPSNEEIFIFERQVIKALNSLPEKTNEV